MGCECECNSWWKRCEQNKVLEGRMNDEEGRTCGSNLLCARCRLKPRRERREVRLERTTYDRSQLLTGEESIERAGDLFMWTSEW